MDEAGDMTRINVKLVSDNLTVAEITIKCKTIIYLNTSKFWDFLK